MLQQKFQESLVNKSIDGTQEKNRGFFFTAIYKQKH